MKKSKSFFAAIFGTFIEYYDYALYGFFAPILAKQFLPHEDPIVALLQTYGIFIVGSFAKPFGSLLFGALGDKWGRTFALRISMFGIIFPTMMIGLLPNFERIGYLAPIGLLLCRMLQGIFVAGESDLARVFVYEMIDKKYQCFSSSMSYFICMIGIYVSSLAPTIFNEETWRIPFLLSGMLGISLYLFRRHLQESPLFLAMQKEDKLKSQISILSQSIHVLRKNKKALFITLLLTGATGGQYHFYFVFLAPYLSEVLGQSDLKTAQILTSHLLLCFSVLLPISGFIADKVITYFQLDLTTLLKRSAFVLIVLVMVNIVYVYQQILPKEMMVLTVLILAFIHASTFVIILALFKTQERCRGTSIGHSIGSMLLSGTTPFISLGLWKITHWSMAPLLYFLFLCGLSYFGFWVLDRQKVTKKQVLGPTQNKDYAYTIEHEQRSLSTQDLPTNAY